MTKSSTQLTQITPRTIAPRIIYITGDLYCYLVVTQNTDDDPLVVEVICGSKRTSHIANHALVFMLRGQRKRCKQPVSYYLTRGSSKGDMLVDFLMEVLDACHSAGLVVVATVCDMGANNVKTLKQLGV